ncbi:MAG TPA: nuclear transport factor 2 family protein [Candidatus Saccharimonadales bacterium]
MDKLDYLTQKDTVERLIIELFIATDLRDWARLEQIFADKVQFNMSSVGGPNGDMTPGDITAMWQEGLAALKAIHHQVGNFVTDINGDEAVANCYGVAYHYLPTKSGRDTRVFVGNYNFTLQKLGDSWKVSAMTFNAKFIDGNKELEKDAA